MGQTIDSARARWKVQDTLYRFGRRNWREGDKGPLNTKEAVRTSDEVADKALRLGVNIADAVNNGFYGLKERG